MGFRDVSGLGMKGFEKDQPYVAAAFSRYLEELGKNGDGKTKVEGVGAGFRVIGFGVWGLGLRV